MSTKLVDLAEKLGLPLKDLKEKIAALGFEIMPRARVIDDEVAELLLAELSAGGAANIEASFNDSLEERDEADVAEIYDEIIGEQQDREIIKSQRKKMAGKDVKAKGATDIAQAAKLQDTVEIGDFITVKEFSEKTGVNVAKLIGELMKNGILANINQQIDFETAQILAEDFGVKLKRLRAAAAAEEMMAGDISKLLREDDAADLAERPPVVCVMGHVDHGKTKLLDTIRQTNVVAGESGGITQHIGAYQVEKKGKLITFLDTPGHEAFTEMRARGARVTDIVVLVVAADEGMKPQTIEALNHAKEAGVPIIVALNKMDKPGANPEMVKGQLSEHGLQPEDWGGKTVVAPVSALTGKGIDELLDLILLTVELEELKANPNREAVGTVIEANLDSSLGPVATVLVNTGTLKIMNNVIVGDTYGRIKIMKDHTGKQIRIALPSTPVQIAGLNATPKSGDILQVVKDERTARLRAAEIALLTRAVSDSKMSSMNQLISAVRSDKILRIVLKADTKGSLEAIRNSIAKIRDEDVAVKIIHDGVGTITESDVMMACASRGIVMGFHSKYDSPNVGKSAEREHIEVREYKVIYDLLEEIKRILTGLLEPEVVEILLGRAEVKQIFLTKKKEMIIGCKVLSGKMKNKGKLRVVRGRTAADEENIIGQARIESLRKVDDVVEEINAGNECGIKYVSPVQVEVGDVLVCYAEEEKRREIT